MSFSSDLTKFIEKAGKNRDTVIRKVALQLQSSMVERSPVDTGRFRGNWQCGIGQANTGTGSGEDKSGSAVLLRTTTALQGWTAGQAILLTNSLPYAQRLEDGYSTQAPSGMVRLTVNEFQDEVRKAVSEL